MSSPSTYSDPLAMLPNGRAVARAAVPALSLENFQRLLLEGVDEGQRVAALFGAAGEGGQGLDVYMVLADDKEARLRVGYTTLAEDAGGYRWPALTPECTQVHLFEREMAEQFGVKLEGHPWNKPVRFAPRMGGAKGEHRRDADATIGVMEFYRVEGDEVHEVAVGPVHAGIIEPGHFRFQCHGEEVFHLEISLGYQHRGVERAMVENPAKRGLHYAETLAGDTTIGHGTAYCQVVEALAGKSATARAMALRGIALELERLANHTGDLGALAGDVGFLPTASFCGRIRGDFLNMTATLCGNRFGRSLLRPGGVRFDLAQADIEGLRRRLDQAEKDCAVAINLLWDSPSVMARFEDIGAVPAKMAVELGLVGPAVRACGVVRDVRQDHPAGIYGFAQIPAASAESGDVLGRAFVRWLEMQRSLAFIKEQLAALPGGALVTPPGPLGGDMLAVSLVEGWRGEICHVALTDAAGGVRRYKVVDPSFHNWTGLAYALRNQQISDFPLCNKSFNLSYCGHDL